MAATDDRYCVGIVGARERCSFRDERFVNDLVERLKKTFGDKLTIVSGGCATGADAFAKNAALHYYSVHYIEHPVRGGTKSRWEYSKAAHERNTLVAQDSRDALFALIKRLRKGGTEDTITKYQNLIIDGDKRRKLYLVRPDLTVERWCPETKELSRWKIWEGNVSRLD